MEYVSHPLIKEGTIEKRPYQEKILGSVSSKSSLVVLPTGLGKTFIAAMLAAHKLHNGSGKIMFLAPTRPLVMQHMQTFLSVFNIEKNRMIIFTGAVSPEKRKEGYSSSDIVFATPQVIENDIIAGRLDVKEFSLIIIDEAHRATGDYAYVFIAKRYNEENTKGTILAITASPGYDRSKIREIMKNLGIEKVHIENEESPDVSPFVHEISIDWNKLDFPENLENSRRLLKSVYDEKIDLLMRFKLTTKPRQYINRRDIIGFGEKLRKKLNSSSGNKGNLFTAIKAQAAALKLSHALEQLETQGAQALLSYFERVKKQKSKTSSELVRDGRVIRALSEARKYEGLHPKMKRLMEILNGLQEGQNAIVFSQYRDTTKSITDEISSIDGIKPIRFVGQSSRDEDEGLSQNKQKSILEDFREGTYNVLVATSVAEEGLDIPSVDLVIFYEPIPSEIRTIQRRGRTGRRRTGKVIILSMKGTIDEAYYKVAVEKEKKMQKVMTQMDTSKTISKGQSKLDTFIEGDRPKVICDSRENPQMIKLLSKKNDIVVSNLDVGDYILSENMGLERKSSSDFLRSLYENKLFDQVKSLSNTFEKAFLIIEGKDIYTGGNVNRSSVRSAMISILVDFRIGIIFSNDMEETSEFIYSMASREQRDSRNLPRLRGDKHSMTRDEGIVYFVEGLPQISSTLARRLLEHFGSIENLVSANEEELMKVDGIGEKKAKAIREIITSPYKK